METMIYTETTVIVRLNEIERYRSENEEGLPFTVNQVMTSLRHAESLENMSFSLRGWAINKDGQSGFINRYSVCSFADLPERVREHLVVEVAASRLEHATEKAST